MRPPRQPPAAYDRGGVGAAASAWRFARLCVGLFLLVVGGCEPREPRAEPVLLFSGSNHGVLAACGCPGNPSGGFAKRQGLIEQYRRSCRHVLLLDAGDLFPDHENKTLVRYLARAAGRVGYDAIALGDQEFLLGARRLRDLRSQYQLPFICANVRDAAGREVVPPHVVRQVGDLVVGIFAVVADRVYGYPPMEWRKGLRIEPPIRAAHREVRALAACDLVVAVSHQPLSDTRRLAAEVPGIDVVVSGHDSTVLYEPEEIGGAILVGTGDQGRFLGALALGRGPKGEVRWSHDLTSLSARVPGAAWAENLYWAYVKEAGEEPPPSWDTPVPKRFEPAEVCNKCHETQFKHWKTTAHSRSYASVKRTGRHEDPECLMCHTMGFGRPGGFVSIEKTPGLGRVTCQGCHAVTSDHKEKGVKPDPRINISSRLCMSCHGPVQSPDFDYFVYRPKILHRPENSGDNDY